MGVSILMNTMRYHTFDLTVSATGAPHEYLLAAESSTQGEAAGRTKIDPSSAPLAELLASLGYGTISAANLQTLGAALYQSLFAGEIGMLLNRALGETIGNEVLGLRLRLRINPPELAALPWEFLYSPERRLFLAASVETPLSRYLNLPEPVRQLAVPEKINLLVVITQNSGLDTTAERKMLEKMAQNIIDRSLETTVFFNQPQIKRPVNNDNDEKRRGKITVDFLEGEATSAAIRAALRQKDYHILHYAGHGAFKRKATSSEAVIPQANARRESFSAEAHTQFQKDPSRMTDEAFIYLDHAEKLTEPITAEQFAHFFTDYAFTRLVFLNACQGATRSSHQALAGVAPQLVLRGVPAVVAMQEKIDNDDAILFATEFYAELCRERDGGQVEVAISRARKALLQEKPNSAVFGNPVLYLRAEEGRLWETQKIEPPPLPQVKEKRPLLERWQTWLTLIGGILAIFASLLDFPEKCSKFSASINEETPTTHFTGVVRDSITQEIIVDAMVIVVGQRRDTVFTTNNGDFSFDKIPGQIGDQVRAYMSKEGYKNNNEYVTLPGPKTLYLVKK